jgi:hypothetical protein
MGSNGSTLAGLKSVETARRGRLGRRAGLGVMLLVPALSFLGIYGPSERTVVSTTDFHRLEMTYGSVVRSGQAVPMEIRITRTNGFAGPVTLVFEQEVFDHFDFQNWYPNPSSEVGEASRVTYEFDPPEGDTLGISLDARVAPTQWGSRETYRLWLNVDGRPVLGTDYTVWVIP